jgi:hypothetical protein
MRISGIDSMFIVVLPFKMEPKIYITMLLNDNEMIYTNQEYYQWFNPHKKYYIICGERGSLNKIWFPS